MHQICAQSEFAQFRLVVLQPLQYGVIISPNTLATAHEMLSQRPEEPENHIHLHENVFENIHPKINFLIEYLKPSFKAIGPEEEI